ncbi:MAG: hypothetical protein JETCAE02_28590 [Anaerolineaceae bacterium]|nr:hypothetical protein [Anaerolineae bacterium]MBL1171783.1 hypothetical protein [Chloroflexota bacterium]MCL4822855.1 hypothetical protein [Anaerolineales bacterium]MDL1927048.1 hypothetical protein [Anaerolineae bacterium AMX1]GJQ40447.1 MAG: hypothetical protein JETCAE02_28590 [Anaerolineaceae bacterium]
MNISLETRPGVKHSKRVWNWALAAALALAAFGWVYYYEPLQTGAYSSYWNDKITDAITLLAVFAAAGLSLNLTRHYAPSEPPRRVWATFTLGWWAWAASESLGFIYDYFYWYKSYPDYTVPEITVMDAFWLLGYFFFGLSLYHQFRLIYRAKGGQKIAAYLLFIAAILLAAFGLTRWALDAGLGSGNTWEGMYLGILYPVLDLLEGAAALWLFFLFGLGYLGRPWWGLILFAFADGIATFFWLGGYNWVSDQAYYTLDLLANLIYLAGYALTALALLAAHEHIERGITAETQNAPQP